MAAICMIPSSDFESTLRQIDYRQLIPICSSLFFAHCMSRWSAATSERELPYF